MHVSHYVLMENIMVIRDYLLQNIDLGRLNKMIRHYLCLSCDYRFSKVITTNADTCRKVTCPLCKASKIDRIYINKSLSIGDKI